MTKFRRVAIVGVGLIGGSLALAARKRGSFEQIMGIGRSKENLKKAKELGVVDDFTTDLLRGVTGADLVVVATPVAAIVPIITEILPHLKEGTIITDVGSVKKEIVEMVDAISLPHLFFVGGHPIAGTENYGVESAFAHLFRGKKCILTPTTKTNVSALEKIKDLWETIGSEVILMDLETHDKIMGAVSHLPHLLAFALVNFLYSLEDVHENIFAFAAGGLRDFTRIAASHPVMWRDIAMLNSSNLLTLLDTFQESLNYFKNLIGSKSSSLLLAELEKSNFVKRNLMQ
ncbi:MAG: prephenate dehydrogenase/arogenate dehydrogenase family protein [Rubrivivax sp.]|nr:prephenate dehydrogenase/arogenate dehydrogenase family protein [Rubrivivax sp.]